MASSFLAGLYPEIRFCGMRKDGELTAPRNSELARLEAKPLAFNSMHRGCLPPPMLFIFLRPIVLRFTSQSLSFRGHIAGWFPLGRVGASSAHHRRVIEKDDGRKATLAKAFLDGSPTSYGAGRVTGLDKHDPLTSVTSSFVHEPRARENRAGRRLTSPREIRRYNS